jgi:hypothetical protein
MPKTESEAVATVAKARASFAAYKGHFTRALKTFDRQVALVLSTEPTAQAVTALDKAHETFLDRYDKACKALDGLIDASIAAGEADDHTDDERDALDDGYSKVEEVFMDAASRLSRGVRRAQAPTPPPPWLPPRAVRPRTSSGKPRGSNHETCLLRTLMWLCGSGLQASASTTTPRSSNMPPTP